MKTLFEGRSKSRLKGFLRKREDAVVLNKNFTFQERVTKLTNPGKKNEEAISFLALHSPWRPTNRECYCSDTGKYTIELILIKKADMVVVWTNLSRKYARLRIDVLKGLRFEATKNSQYSSDTC